MLEDRYYRNLMSKSLDGDSVAYKTLLGQISKDVNSFLKSKLSSKEQIEDIIQDILLSIHKSKHTYDPARLFGPWLFSIVRHKLADFHRKNYRVSEHEVSFENGQLENIESAPGACTVEVKEVLSMMDKLTSKQKDLIYSAKILGLSIREISEEFDMSTSSVKVSIHRSMNLLKEMLYGK